MKGPILGCTVLALMHIAVITGADYQEITSLPAASVWRSAARLHRFVKRPIEGELRIPEDVNSRSGVM